MAAGKQRDICVTIILVSICQTNTEYLLFASPGPVGSDSSQIGLWGGHINSSVVEGENDFFSMGHVCMKYQDYSTIMWKRNGLNIWSIHYDFLLDRLMLQSTELESLHHLTYMSGKLCDSVPSCDNPTHALLWNSSTTPSKTGPFVTYMKDRYFISQRAADTQSMIMELRQLDNCENILPVKHYPMPILACSHAVATLYNYTVKPEWQLIPGSQVLIKPTAWYNVFAIQTYNITQYNNSQHVTVTLLEFTLSGLTRILYKEDLGLLNTSLAHLRDLSGLGSLSLKNNRLCWTSISTVRCAWWDNQNFNDIRLLATQDLVKHICAGKALCSTVCALYFST